ncbi:MAG: hypothetical protein QOI83_280 [Streptomycetaceae bacterium]|nr:hypothetical protein [Streptomycetaceae bacterium]
MDLRPSGIASGPGSGRPGWIPPVRILSFPHSLTARER